MILKKLDPVSAYAPKFIRKLIGLKARPEGGCIIRPGGLGDLVILTLAAIRLNIDLRQIQWLVEKRNKVWCEILGLPFVCYDDISALPSLLLGREGGFSWVIDSEQTFGLSAVLACRLLPSNNNLIGYSTSRASQLYDIKVDHPLSRDHELDTFSKLLSQADQAVGLPKLKEEVQYLPEELNCPKGIHVVLAIGGRQAAERALDIEVWIKLAQIARQYSDEVYLIGHANDLEFAAKLMERAPWIKTNLLGQKSFLEVCKLIKSAVRLVSIDSGLVHVASFLNVPATVLFVDPKKKERWAPLAEGSASLMLEELDPR